jgi:hypothetical protein
VSEFFEGTRCCAVTRENYKRSQIGEKVFR